jgi:tetratricopeptide (TPR) repeat protein
MDTSNRSAMLAAASELATESRWREVVDLAKKIVAMEPSQYTAWWLLAQSYDGLQRKSDALYAYAQYYQNAPKHGDLRATREFAASQAGIPFQEAEDIDIETAHPLENFKVTIGGQRLFVQTYNDAGKPIAEVIEAAEALVKSSNPFEAWLHLRKHPELLTAVADTILSSMAQAQSDVRARASVEWYREALRRVREGDAVAPFAKLAQISEVDFLAFVTAADDLQPVLIKLIEATADAERDALLEDHPELVVDDRTLTFLRILGGVQGDPEAREAIQSLFTLIRRTRRGRAGVKLSRPPPGLQEALDQATAAAESGGIAEINVALAEWYSIDVQKAVEPSLVALTRGVLLLARLDRTGDTDDLRKACTILQDAMNRDADPDSPMLPYHYAIALLRRFEHEGSMADLDKAIAALQQVLTLVVDGTVVEGAARSLLGSILMRRADMTGNISDLNESIAMQRVAITAHAKAEDLAGRLANLATACLNHFGISGDIAKLDEAEGYYKEILELAPGKGCAPRREIVSSALSHYGKFGVARPRDRGRPRDSRRLRCTPRHFTRI